MTRSRQHEPRLTGAQLRAARGLLNLSAETLADKTKLSLKTIRRAEQVDDTPVPITAANAERIRSVLEDRGAQFTDSNGNGPGVRLRRNPPPIFGAGSNRALDEE